MALSRWWLLTWLFAIHIPVSAQFKDTAEVLALSQRCKQFQEDKADSLLIYSVQIEKYSAKQGFVQGISDAMRFKGMHFEYSEKYDSAIRLYLQNIDFAKKNLPPDKSIALYTDLMAVYKATRQFDEVKRWGLQMKKEAETLNDSARLSSALTNLGIAYRNTKQRDSAVACYKAALIIKEKIGDFNGLANLRINLAAYYEQENMFAEMLQTILPNIAYHEKIKDSSNLFYDYSNAAAALIGLKRYDEALVFAGHAKTLAEAAGSLKIVEVLEIYSGLYKQKGNYRKSLEYMEQSLLLERKILNENTTQEMAEAREKFQTELKEEQNKVLTEKLDNEKLKKRNTMLLAIAAAMVALLVGLGLWQKQKINKQLEEKNTIIGQQVEKMAELNNEKNNLISVVSHDLAGPLSQIQVWSQLLERKQDTFSATQKEAIQHILQSASQGQSLIRNILDVEKAETGSHTLQLESTNLSLLGKELVTQWTLIAAQKNIELVYEAPEKIVWLLTDRQLFKRIAENLLSNAVKYSAPGKKIWLSLTDHPEEVQVQVRDEGPGIPQADIPFLFKKYNQSNANPTANESSTGLGLFIVKRIAEELHAKINVESKEGEGSCFTVSFKK